MSKIVAALAIAALASATPALANDGNSPDAELAKLLEGRVAGEPVNCISLNSVTSSTVIEGKAIVYQIGTKLYDNEPRSGADRLDDDDVLLTRNYGSQLCRIDSVQLIDRNSRFVRGFVVLDRFVPYTKIAEPK